MSGLILKSKPATEVKKMNGDEVEKQLKKDIAAYRAGFTDGYQTAKSKQVLCSECKYYEDDSTVITETGFPMIIGHDICTRWGDGCKTSPSGYCFLAKRREE